MVAPNATIPEWAGYVSTLFTGLFFGSNFVPVKTYDAGDGLFFQWILCAAIFCLGFVVYVARGFPPFQPLAMLGGALWCVGNLMSVPIINMIGLSLGMLLWGTTSLLMGWATGTFGLFWVHKTPVATPWMNYLAAGLAVVATLFFGFISPQVKEEDEKAAKRASEQQEAGEDEIENMILNHGGSRVYVEKKENVFVSVTKNCSPTVKRILGVALSILSGILYGSNFTPPEYVMAHCPNNCSQSPLDYVYSHFCGIYLASTLFFISYCGLLTLLKRKIFAPKEIILPAFISGLMWATAQVLSFIAIGALGLSVAFPMISILPALVASMWGLFVFKEITGWQNYALFGAAFAFVVASSLLDAFSK